MSENLRNSQDLKGEVREDCSNSSEQKRLDRRRFLKGAATATAVAGLGTLAPALKAQNSSMERAEAAGLQGSDFDFGGGRARAFAAFQVKQSNAAFQLNKQIPAHTHNGDEANLPGFVGSYHKGLPTINQFGEVDPGAYHAMLAALNNGNAAAFERIPLGGTLKLTNPQAGLAFDTEGVDDHQIFQPPSPSAAGAERAAEAVENYWMALSRDVAFTEYGNETLTEGAIAELNGLAGYNAPKSVTAQNLFRLGLGDPNLQGTGAFSDTVGPYVSQYMLVARNMGAHQLTGEMRTYRSLTDGGVNYLTDAASWLATQQGNIVTDDSANFDSNPRYVRNGRDISQWVHVDLLYQGYLEALLVLSTYGAPLSPANPYTSSHTQAGFGTLGMPFAQSLLAEVGRRALQAQWFQKWYVHRALRPEAFGGLVHYQITAGRYPFLNASVVNSKAVQQTFSQNGTYFLPMVYPEGSPSHPSYGSGHATVAGACVTILKAVFNETTPISHLFEPQVTSADGLSLLSYSGSDAGQMTVGSELNKVAMNVAVARNIAGVHWHSDALQAVLTGEQVAISVLQDVKNTLNEFRTGGGGFSFHDFRGNSVNI